MDALDPPAAGSHPWCVAAYSFAGWVPNVSGHLSFNQVDPRGRRSTFNHQGDTTERRTVVAHRARLAQDFPFWDWLVRLFRPEANLDFVLVAESGPSVTPFFRNGKLDEIEDDHGALYGCVIVLPRNTDRPAEVARRDFLRELDDAIAQALAERARGGIPTGARMAVDVLAAVSQLRGEAAAFMMRFALFRTGECRIWFELDELLGRDLTVEPADANELALALALPPQAYFFIKDLLHVHYHHDPHSDQILQLTRLTGGSSDPVVVRKDEVRWRYATLRGLVRVVVELRQSRSLQGHKRAIGILAYAGSFQNVLARAMRTAGGGAAFADNGELIPYEFGHLAASLEATDSSLETITTSRLQLFAIEVGIFLSALALWAGAVQIQPILCQKNVACPPIGPGAIIALVNEVVANPSLFIVAMLATGFLFFVAFFRGTGAIPYAERSVRWLKGLAVAVATQISRWSGGSDGLGYVLGAALLTTIGGGAAKIAYKLVPKTHVPPVMPAQPAAPPAGPWAPLARFVGQPLATSGLLTDSVVAAEVRNLLGSDYRPFLAAVGRAPLQRQGNLFYAIVGPKGEDGGGYLILDARAQRIATEFRLDGRPHPHRSPGGEMALPPAIARYLGHAAGFDVDPVPMDVPRCNSLQSGTNGRTLQLSGALRHDAICTYAIPLQRGQIVSYDPLRVRGLRITFSADGHELSETPDFTAVKDGRYVVTITWAGWNPPRRQVALARPFFARLDIR